ncbi:MAG: hypothetical protein AB8B97_11835 [Granulosicoccus sp.]
MSESIPVSNYNNVNDHQPDLGYKIFNHGSGIAVETTHINDVIELIWHEDGTLTIVINGDAAIRLDAVQAQEVLINSQGGNDLIFVTGDTPEGNTLRLHGSSGNDRIIGSNGEEQLEGSDGVDRLWGMGGDDILYSGDNDDSGDGSTDYLYGGTGDDHLHGGSGDQLHGNADADTYYGGGVQWNDYDDVNPTGSPGNYEVGDQFSEYSEALPEELESLSSVDNVASDSPVAGAEEAPVEPDSDLGPGPAPDDLPVADPPIGLENMDVPEELPVPSGANAEEQRQLILEQLEGFYTTTIEDLEQASADSLKQAQLAADAGDMDAASAWAAKAEWYASQAERLSAAAEVRFELAAVPADPDDAQAFVDPGMVILGGLDKIAGQARENADEAERVASGAEPEDETSESTDEEPVSESTSEEPSASESDEPEAASSPALAEGDPGDQVSAYSEQLTGFYAEEIALARENAQTAAEKAQIYADSGNTELAEQWARTAIREANRAETLLQEAQARLAGALVQLNELLNDPDATQEAKDDAQKEFDDAKEAVTTAEGEAAKARVFAEDARSEAGLSEDDDGSVPPSDDATTGSEPDDVAPGADGDEPSAAGADGDEPGAAGADGEESGDEVSESSDEMAADATESGDDPYDQAMDNASDGTNRQESDRRSRGARSGNFLIAMAESLGLMQAKFLGNALKSLEIMDNLSEKTFDEKDFNGQRQHREDFLIAQSTFQADMQMFNIISQASATALRSTGEGMAAVVRKN